MSILLKELTALDSAIKPLLFLFNLIVKHGKHPDLTSLEPYEFICIKNATVSVKTAEISTVLKVLRLLKPEREYVVQKFALVLLREFLEIHNSTGLIIPREFK